MGDGNASISIEATSMVTRHTVRAKISGAPKHQKRWSDTIVFSPDLVTVDYQHGGYPVGEWSVQKVTISGYRVLSRGNISHTSRAEDVFYTSGDFPDWVHHLVKACLPIGEVK